MSISRILLLFVFILILSSGWVTAIKIEKNQGVNDDYLHEVFPADNTFSSSVDLLKIKNNPIRPNLYGIDVQSSDVVTVVGEASVIIRTNNGGKSWRQQKAWTFNVYEEFTDVSFYDENIGAAVGLCNSIVHTKSGGRIWYTSQHPGLFQPIITLFCAQMLTPEIGFAAGQFSLPINNIYKTNDQWKSWVILHPVLKNESIIIPRSYISDIHFINNTNGVVSSSDWAINWVWSGIILTTDGGTTWNTVCFEEGHGYEALDFTDEKIGYALGIGWYNYSYFSNKIIKTYDSGKTWELVNNKLLVGDRDSYIQLNDISFPTKDIGFAVGKKGVIIKTKDGGKTWEKQESGTQNTLNAVELTDQNTGYVCGDHGTVLLTQDGGETWSIQNIHWRFTTIFRTLLRRIIYGLHGY